MIQDVNLLLTDEEAPGDGPGVQGDAGQGVEWEEAAALDAFPNSRSPPAVPMHENAPTKWRECFQVLLPASSFMNVTRKIHVLSARQGNKLPVFNSKFLHPLCFSRIIAVLASSISA